MSRLKSLLGDLIVILVALLAGYAFTQFVMFRAIVSGDSMKPTYVSGEACYALVNANINRGDVVIIKSDDENQKHLIKRVVGLPGETIQITNSTLFINGVEYPEDYLSCSEYYSGLAEEPIVLGYNEYFVLGDNRPISSDSRVFGAVSRNEIKGVVINGRVLRSN